MQKVIRYNTIRATDLSQTLRNGPVRAPGLKEDNASLVIAEHFILPNFLVLYTVSIIETKANTDGQRYKIRNLRV